MKKILIIGACSAIARAYADIQARHNHALFLVARDGQKLQQLSADLTIKGAASLDTYTLDINDHTAHQKMLETCMQSMGKIDIALIAHGTLPDQQKVQESPEHAKQEFFTNGLSTILVLTNLANFMEKQQSGTIAVITSVAGDRGRPSNYLYGASKAAVSTFCEGLRARLYRANTHVLEIRPGFVNTPMTKHLSLPPLLLSTPEKIASCIEAAINKHKNIIYAPWFWFWILLIIKKIPTSIFKKLRL